MENSRKRPAETTAEYATTLIRKLRHTSNELIRHGTPLSPFQSAVQSPLQSVSQSSTLSPMLSPTLSHQEYDFEGAC